jgi:hypothetical protein
LEIRDRIKELRRVPASQLRPHPRNWRTHPAHQRDALKGLLADVGYADALLVRELPDGALELIDGHLRAETTPDSVVPVLVLDVDEREAQRILLTHDPLASLAETDNDQLTDLLNCCEFENKAVQQMLSELSPEKGEAKTLPESCELAEIDVPEAFQVVVECSDEAQQQSLYERMREEGFQCRLLTL